MKSSFIFAFLIFSVINIQAINSILDYCWNSKANPFNIALGIKRKFRMYEQGTKTVDDFTTDAKESCNKLADATKKGVHTLNNTAHTAVEAADTQIYHVKKAIQNNEILYGAANVLLMTGIYGLHYTVRGYKAITGK